METRNNARYKVWNSLRKVAIPESRFHFNFNEFIPDFIGSEFATNRLIELEIYKESDVIFVIPDNCYEIFRAQAVRDKKTITNDAEIAIWMITKFL